MQSEGILAKYGPVSFVSDTKEPAPLTVHATEVAERDTWESAPLIRTRAQQLRFEVVRCQVARRRNPRANAGTGALVGGLGLGVAGWAAGVALAPATAGISIPAVLLGGLVVGLSAGAGLGAAMPLHLNFGQFSSVRLHLLKKVGVVATDRESERIVKALQAGLVISEDRQRYILAWDRLESALRPLALDPTTHERVVEALTIVRDEGPLYDTLVVCRQLLANAMQAMTERWKPGCQDVEQRDTCARLLERVQAALSNFGDRPLQQADRLLSEATLLLAELNGVAKDTPEPLITRVRAPASPQVFEPPLAVPTWPAWPPPSPPSSPPPPREETVSHKLMAGAGTALRRTRSASDAQRVTSPPGLAPRRALSMPMLQRVGLAATEA